MFNTTQKLEIDAHTILHVKYEALSFTEINVTFTVKSFQFNSPLFVMLLWS